MANIGSLTANLRLESAAFIRDMTKAQRAVASNTAAMRRSMQQVERASRNVQRQFSQLRGAAVALAGALAVRQFTQFAKSAINTGDALAKQARQLQITASEFQRYRIEGELAGVATQKLESGIGAFTKRVGELRAGTGTLVTILDKSNVALKNQLLAATSTEEGLRIMLRAIQESGTAFDKQALSAAAFGRQAGQAMVLLADEAGTLNAEMVKLVTISDSVLKASEHLEDQFTLLKAAFSAGFDTSIIEGMAGSVEATAESMREAREIGEEFGRAVGAAMRGVAEAAKFVGRNMREIVAVAGALIALKLAGIVLGMAKAFLALAVAMRAAAAAGGIMAAVSAGAKKGLVGLAAAAATFAAIMVSIKETEPAILDAVEAVKQFGSGVADAGAGSGVAAKKVADLTKAQNQLTSDTLALIVAHKKSDAEYKRVKKSIDLHNDAMRQGVDVTTEQGRAWLEAARTARDLQDELAEMVRKREEDSRAMEEQVKRQQELMQEPFKNAIRGIQDSFTDAFENIF
jgi:hypothetical protein